MKTGQLSVTGRRMMGPKALTLFFVMLLICLSSSLCAGETKTIITADRLEYFGSDKKVAADGSVVIERDGAVMKADSVTYMEESSEATVSGHVRYDDADVSIKADRAELNLETKKGTLLDAEIYQKRYGYRLAGKHVEKSGEDSYYSPDASLTTCDAPLPAWCFRGKKVAATEGKYVTSRGLTFFIKGLPVLYSPYAWAPINTERASGFLMPVVGNSSSRGFELSVPFFLVLSENSDATLTVEEYSKRGVGTGLEFRFIGLGGLKSEWQAYHIRDSVLDKDFVEVRALHEERHADRLGGFLSINYVNEKDFYRIYSWQRDLRTSRFLESTGEINAPVGDGRFYLLSQYWVDLEQDTGSVPQRVPELGYELPYTKVGDFMVSLGSNAANFWRKDGVSAARADVFPKVLHTVRTEDFTVSQSLTLREDLYSFYGDAGGADRQERGSLSYDLVGHTRLYKSYPSFTHVVEPSLGYHLLSSSQNDLPVFDEAETVRPASFVDLQLLNRVIVKGSEVITFRLSDAVDTRRNSRPFMPVMLDIGIRSPFRAVLGISYDVNTGMIETASADTGFHVMGVNVGVGGRYNRAEDVMTYTASADFNLMKSLQVTGQLWYDAKGPGLRDATVKVRYARQCWAVRLEAAKKPGDFSTRVLIELAGLTSRMSKGMFTPSEAPF